MLSPLRLLNRSILCLLFDVVGGRHGFMGRSNDRMMFLIYSKKCPGDAVAPTLP